MDIRDAADSPLLADVRSHDAFRYVQHNIAQGFAIRCDEIYNLAAPSRLRYDRILPVETLRMNVQGTVNTLEAARNERARVVYGSSSCVYGSRGREPSAEEHLRNTGRYMLAVRPRLSTGPTAPSTAWIRASPAYSTPTVRAPTSTTSAWR